MPELLAGNVLEGAGNILGHFVGGAVNLVGDAINQVQAIPYGGLRKEVPFERWFFDFSIANDVVASKLAAEKLEARFWALLSLGESLGRSVLALIRGIFYEIVEKKASRNHQIEILYVQCNSARFSLLATISPRYAIHEAKKFNEDGSRRIGRLMPAFRNPQAVFVGNIYAGS